MPDYGFLAQGNNPFETVGKIALVQNQVNQNKLFQGQQAAGQALQQSINPDTGLLDTAAYGRRIALDPQIAPYAADALTHGLDAQNKLIANNTNQTALNAAFTKNLTEDIAGQTPGAVPGIIFRGVATGRYPQSVAEQFLGGGMEAGGKTFGQHMEDLSKQAAIQSGSATAMESAFGSPAMVDTGSNIQPTSVNRVSGQAAPMGAPIAKTLTPESSAARQGIIHDGAPASVPTSALVTPTGQPRVENGLTGPHGETKTGFSPAEQAAGAATGTGLAGMGLQIVQRASKVPDNKAILGNMEGLLDGFTPGPQSGFWKQINQVASQYGVAPPGSAPQTKAQAQEEFGKLAFQLAQQQFQAMGGTGTDAKLDSTMHTSPSDLLTKYGNKGIIHLLKGNEDAVRAYSEAWQKWQDAGHGPESLGQFQAQWNRIYDPRVFQSAYMSPEERQSMLKGMTASEQTQFKAAFKRAHSLGWVR
jgi:hypothetical protein